MDTKFTPGPWTAVAQNGAGPMIAREYETGNQMTPTGLRLIAHMLQRKSSLDEDQANARLIAAAPDMYEALKNLLLQYEDQSDTAITKAYGMATYLRVRDARAALAKTGGQ